MINSLKKGTCVLLLGAALSGVGVTDAWALKTPITDATNNVIGLLNVAEVGIIYETNKLISDTMNDVCTIMGSQKSDCKAKMTEMKCVAEALKKEGLSYKDADGGTLSSIVAGCAGEDVGECVSSGFDELTNKRQSDTSETSVGEISKTVTNALTGDQENLGVTVADSVYEKYGSAGVGKQNMELVKACLTEVKSKTRWNLTGTVPGSDETAPTVPTNIQKIMNGTNGGDAFESIRGRSGGDESEPSKVAELQAEIKKTLLADPQAALSTDGKTGSEATLNNVNDARANQNLTRLNTATQAYAFGGRAAALATASGEEVAKASDYVEKTDDIVALLKQSAGAVAQSYQKINAITELRAKMLELQAMENIVAGGVVLQDK